MNLESATGILSGTPPTSTTTVFHTFYVEATSVEWIGPQQKLITLKVNFVIKAIEPVSEQISGGNPVSLRTPEGKTAVTTAQVGTAAVVGIGTVSSLFSGSKLSVIWAALNQLQIMVLILLVENFLPTDLQSYIQGVEFALFDFEFIPIKKIDFLTVPINWVDFEQPNPNLSLIGVESRSTLVNALSVVLVYI